MSDWSDYARQVQAAADSAGRRADTEMKSLKCRIDELEKACDEWSEVSQSNYQRAKVAEAKLADAMEALQFYRSAVNLRIDCEITHAMQEAHIHAEAFIAKIKGEQT